MPSTPPVKDDRFEPFPMDALSRLVDGWSALEILVPEARRFFPNRQIRLIDLRVRDLFDEAHIPGASHLALEEIATPYLRPRPGRTLLVVGASVEQAAEGARLLREAGYAARAMDGPVSEWPGPWETGRERTPAWEPSDLARRWASHLPTGRLLDLACGSGRDAVFFAMQGFEVTAIDNLADALLQAQSLSRRHRVSCCLLRGDVEADPACWAGPWDGIHVHRFLHRPLLDLIPRRLRPGGVVLYETFLETQSAVGRRPRDAAHLLKSGELLRAAQGLSVTEYREGVNDEGDWTAALVARREENRGA